MRRRFLVADGINADHCHLSTLNESDYAIARSNFISIADRRGVSRIGEAVRIGRYCAKWFQIAHLANEWACMRVGATREARCHDDHSSSAAIALNHQHVPRLKSKCLRALCRPINAGISPASRRSTVSRADRSRCMDITHSWRKCICHASRFNCARFWNQMSANGGTPLGNAYEREVASMMATRIIAIKDRISDRRRLSSWRSSLGSFANEAEDKLASGARKAAHDRELANSGQEMVTSWNRPLIKWKWHWQTVTRSMNFRHANEESASTKWSDVALISPRPTIRGNRLHL